MIAAYRKQREEDKYTESAYCTKKIDWKQVKKVPEEVDTVKIEIYNIDSVKIGGLGMVQQRQTYHHKDLRNALIETGIQLVSTEGANAFSLRKVAAACGVSHAAPYSHFQNKEELLEAMQLFITDRFSKQLEKSIQKNNTVAEILKDMGVAYVSFFVENPAYFQFLYAQSNIKIDLSLSIPDEQKYKPYVIYKNIVSKLLQQAHYSEEKQNDIIITIWAFIHGVASLAAMNNVKYDNDWREKVVDFMDIFPLSFLDNAGEKI